MTTEVSIAALHLWLPERRLAMKAAGQLPWTAPTPILPLLAR